MSDRQVSDRTRAAAVALVRRYPVARSALLPLLHLVQAEHGYVTDEGIAFCAEMVGLTKAEVGAVATFYTMFKREPVGDYLLSVCTNPTCKIAGAGAIYQRYVDELGGHSDPDRGVSVEHAECLGICDGAPVVQINYEMYGPVSQEQADQLLEACVAGDPPVSPWSGEKPGTFREVAWDLSGAADGTDEWLAAAARAQTEAAHPPAYRSGETDIPVTHPGGDPRGHGGELFRTGFASPDGVRGSDEVEAAPQKASPEQQAVAAEVAEESADPDAAEHVAEGTRPTTPAADAPAETEEEG